MDAENNRRSRGPYLGWVGNPSLPVPESTVRSRKRKRELEVKNIYNLTNFLKKYSIWRCKFTISVNVILRSESLQRSKTFCASSVLSPFKFFYSADVEQKKTYRCCVS